jgi:phage-related minor tail protein
MASGRIRGLTIEIGGDTTKLTDSLKSIDKELSNTQKDLKDIDKLLKFDPKNTDLLKQKQEQLGKAVKLSKERVQQLEEAQKQMGERTEENAKQYDALERELIDAKSKTKQYQDELKKTAGEANGLTQALKDVSDKAGVVSEKTKGLSTLAGGLGIAMLGNAYASAQAADELNTLSRNLGVSVEELQKMQYASDLIDVSMDQMTGSMEKLTKQMGSNSKVFEELGINIYNADGSLRDATDVWYESLEALSQVENGTERDRLAMELFGKSAMDLSGIIDDGGAGLKAYGDEAENMGLILSQDDVDAANKFNDAIDKLKATAGASFLEMGATLAEELTPALEKIVEIASQLFTWFASLDGSTQAFILTVLGLVAAISPIAGIISTITGMAAALNVAMLPMIGTIGGIVVGVGAAVAAGVALYKNWDTIKKKASELWKNIQSTFENIRKSISEKIEAAKEAVRKAIDAIKGFFNFNWKLPRLKMPHFSVSGSANPLDWFSQGVPKISVSWYAKAMRDGMILNSPTIFGMQNGRLLGGGEAGSEVVVGTNSLMNMIRQASGESVTINVYPSPGMDERQLANEVQRVFVNQMNSRKAVFE